MLTLESAHNALTEHKNFNLAEVLISQYCNSIPQDSVDKKLTKSILNASRDRNFDLLLAVVEAEIERLSTIKIKLLREKIIRF